MGDAGAVVLILVVLAVVWQVDVRRRPIRRCPRCSGSRHNAGSDSVRWGICRRCGGRGEVRRFGAGGGN